MQHGIAEGVALADVAGDLCRAAAGLGVGVGQGTSADSCISGEGTFVIVLEVRRDLHVAQLAHVEVAAAGAGGPAEEEVAGGLHQALALDHPLAFVAGAQLGFDVVGEHRAVGFLELQEERLLLGIGEQRD